MLDTPRPGLNDVIRAAVESAVADIHVAIPARVERVDLAKGLVDATPLVKEVGEDAEGARLAKPFPVITNVPIVFPGAGGMRITFPVAAGDVVLLIFSERSLDKWLSQGGEVDPIDPRRHHLSDAIAIPGLRPFSAPWQGADAGVMTIGAQGGPFQSAGLGQDIRDELDDIRSKFASHTHVLAIAAASGSGGTGTAAVTTTVLAPAKTIKSGTVKLSE